LKFLFINITLLAPFYCDLQTENPHLKLNKDKIKKTTKGLKLNKDKIKKTTKG
jgi:hypothetical protein